MVPLSDRLLRDAATAEVWGRSRLPLDGSPKWQEGFKICGQVCVPSGPLKRFRFPWKSDSLRPERLKEENPLVLNLCSVSLRQRDLIGTTGFQLSSPQIRLGAVSR